MDYVEDGIGRAIEKAMDKMTEGMPPRVIMRDRVPDGGYVSRNGRKEVESREIEFIGLRKVDGRTHAMISASQMWTEEYFKRLDARNPGPIGTPKGEQMKMLIPLKELLSFVQGVEKALGEWKGGQPRRRDN
jgi:hypothetical protein